MDGPSLGYAPIVAGMSSRKRTRALQAPLDELAENLNQSPSPAPAKKAKRKLEEKAKAEQKPVKIPSELCFSVGFMGEGSSTQ